MSSTEGPGDGGAGSSAGSPASLEAENAQLKAEIAFLQKKLQLVGSITRHDVLNQMTAIMGYNELLRMMVEDEKQKTFLEKERQAVDKIRRQFQFAKDYQNLATESPRWQNVSNTVHRVTEEFDTGSIRITALTGDMAVLADPLLDKALIQIFDNTVRHGGKATEIRVSLQDEGSRALLVIEDDGCGIPAPDKEKIFERGFGKGTGWGLFLAREILGITGITIAENGEPGKGARFIITLPAGTYRSGAVE
jgi:signal transduction histidine kinase